MDISSTRRQIQEAGPRLSEALAVLKLVEQHELDPAREDVNTSDAIGLAARTVSDVVTHLEEMDDALNRGREMWEAES